MSQEGKRRLDLDLKFPFPADYQQVEKIIQQTIHAYHSDKLLTDPPLRTGITTIDADGFHVAVNVWVQPHGFVDIKMDLQVKLLQDLKAGGIKLPGM